MKIADIFTKDAKIQLQEDGTLFVLVDEETYMNTRRVFVEHGRAGTLYYMDMIEVVRCKDCDRSRKTELGWVCTNTGASVASDGNGYCSNGRRRTNEGNVLR